MQKVSSTSKVATITAFLCIILGGSGLLYYSTMVRPNEFHTQATAVAGNFLRAQAQATLQANMMATARASATDGAFQNQYLQITSNKPTFTDSLTGSQSRMWPTYTSSQGNCIFENKTFHVEAPAQRINVCTSALGYHQDFAFQVKMTILSGFDGGLIFRATASSTGSVVKAYLFTASAGYYELDTVKNGTPQPILRNYTNAIRPDWRQSNVLTVIARGSTIALYVNAHYVGEIEDPSSPEGLIGLYASGVLGLTADVAFNDAEVWSL